MREKKAHVIRPAGHRKSAYPGWKDPSLAEALTGLDTSGSLEDRLLRFGANALSGDPVRAALALEELRAIVRRELADPAAALGIPPEHPLLAEWLALALADRAKLWSRPVDNPGRGRKPLEETVVLYRRLEDFLMERRAEKHSVSERAVFNVNNRAYRVAFRDLKPETARRILSRGRKGNWGQNRV